jgi:hypothetical protein
VRLTSPIGSAAGGSVNLSTSLSNVAKLAAHPKFVWVFNANCDGTIIYNDPVFILRYSDNSVGLRPIITKKWSIKDHDLAMFFNEENLLNKTDPKCITNCGKMVSR